ncbi:MAG: hypothetical protein F4X82_02205 [Candidatus Spechtbacteria bacterium SB0662_bin_43]|uniref:Uncharacterized protein n=1 Tax=Candidatus Spechtbacteria bacterium SB0662_bin_43 TaxID=2604897 RepID=A0A845DA27_9BACT|nr:hypothetical protein [Candidatus Spechtbacteria bacterium SB0662_bin_43]
MENTLLQHYVKEGVSNAQGDLFQYPKHSKEVKHQAYQNVITALSSIVYHRLDEGLDVHIEPLVLEDMIDKECKQ